MVALILLGVLTVNEAAAMNAEPVKVSLWRKGESIGGEDILPMNEQVIDYLATLRRPTEPNARIIYSCQIKMKTIRPSVFGSSPNPGTFQYVYVQAVYELSDCVEFTKP